MLKPEDGFQRGRAELRGEVAHLQRLLIKAGYKIKSDGFYGPATEATICELQKQHALNITGVVDDLTWKALEKDLLQQSQTQVKPASAKEHTASAQNNSMDSAASCEDLIEDNSSFVDFKGQLEWIHEQEGHAGKPYWPGGGSGVTLDPGFDLGHNDIDITTETYKDILTEKQLNAINAIIGLTGRRAKEALNNSPELLSIRVSKYQASKIFSGIALPYWKAICKRMLGLNRADTPGSVQTALLSLAFNRGYNNSGLEVLRRPIEQRDWYKCAQLISSMQQDHRLEGIRARRQREGKLIFNELAS